MRLTRWKVAQNTSLSSDANWEKNGDGCFFLRWFVFGPSPATHTPTRHSHHIGIYSRKTLKLLTWDPFPEWLRTERDELRMFIDSLPNNVWGKVQDRIESWGLPDTVCLKVVKSHYKYINIWLICCYIWYKHYQSCHMTWAWKLTTPPSWRHPPYNISQVTSPTKVPARCILMICVARGYLLSVRTVA